MASSRIAGSFSSSNAGGDSSQSDTTILTASFHACSDTLSSSVFKFSAETPTKMSTRIISLLAPTFSASRTTSFQSTQPGRSEWLSWAPSHLNTFPSRDTSPHRERPRFHLAINSRPQITKHWNCIAGRLSLSHKEMRSSTIIPGETCVSDQGESLLLSSSNPPPALSLNFFARYLAVLSGMS